MTKFELVEGVRSRVDATYEEAKNALEKSNWDILEAVALLEKQGKAAIVTDGGVQYRKAPEEEQPQPEPEKEQDEGWSACENCAGEECDECDGEGSKGDSQSEDKKRDGTSFGDFVRRVCKEKFTVKRGGDSFANIPAVVIPIALIAAFWPSVVILLLGMVFGFEYGFSGPTLDKTPLNSWTEKANKFFSRFKKDFSNRK